MLDSRPKGRGFEPHRRHCVVSLSKNINPSLVLVQPRKTRPFITVRLLMGRKESNQTNKQNLKTVFSLQMFNTNTHSDNIFTVVPTKSDSDEMFCLQLLSKQLTCTLHLTKRESTDHLCINPILWIGLIHK